MNFDFAIGSLCLEGACAAGAVGNNDVVFEKGAVWILMLESHGMDKFHQKISEEAGNLGSPLMGNGP